jgi:predicted dithiol-disulfide oxidoreductase (DUF899 family)
MATQQLKPANELAHANGVRFPKMGSKTTDPGQDPRGAPDLMPLWTILDCTPEGRGTDWYPKLRYTK